MRESVQDLVRIEFLREARGEDVYERFGAFDSGGRGEFRLYFPGPGEYVRGGEPEIEAISVSVRAIHPFHDAPIEVHFPIEMTRGPHQGGTLWQAISDPLPEGFYEYKYRVRFTDGQERLVGDPCARYSGHHHENSGLVIGGSTPADNVVPPLDGRLPIGDLVIYELLIDDFTREYRGIEAPVDAVRGKLDELVELGVNAIEFLPWTAWPGEGFSWGYNPFAYFAVENRYITRADEPVEKLSRLKRLISECHARQLHVIMDGVFNHAEESEVGRGFPYFWFYREPANCPFIGRFADAAFFKDLDYGNDCTLQFVLDVCRYWIDVFRIDGLRLDYTRGFYDAGSHRGLPDLVAGIRSFVADQAEERLRSNFTITLEHLTDNRFEAIDVANRVSADSCWFDAFFWRSHDFLAHGINPDLMRVLDARRDFGPGRAPTLYIENHDHSEVVANAGGRSAWHRTQPYAIALFTSPGAVLIYNGQEFGDDYWIPEHEPPARVVPRPKRWEMSEDETGRSLRWLYGRLMAIRRAHPALRSANFYPGDWASWMRKPNPAGYGIDVDKQVVVYHRWGHDGDGRLHRYVIVLNFSPHVQHVDVPLPDGGEWEDLISGWRVTPLGDRLLNQGVGGNWGHVFHKQG